MSTGNQVTSDSANSACQAWILRRKDGVTFGFTDHDEEIEVDGVSCFASSGLSAVALSQSTGLAVDNSEATGALMSGVLEEADIAAGYYDGAEIWIWDVDWNEPSAAELRFRGSLGEINRIDGAFKAEIRGLSDKLNSDIGRVYQTNCDAILGDTRCGVDLSINAFRLDTVIVGVDEDGYLAVTDTTGFDDRWFERGVISFSDGKLTREFRIKLDSRVGTERKISVWNAADVKFQVGDSVVLTAGCDKRFATCKSKFSNTLNFQGFPTLPGEDWVMAYPNSTQTMDGGKR